MNKTSKSIDLVPGQFGGRTAAEWREMAAQSARRSAESWERSDTDGFLSQWASDTMAARYRDNATIAERDGRFEFPALFTLAGDLVHARYFEGKFGWCWMLLDEHGQRTGTYVTESSARKGATRKANMAKKGYTMGRVLIPARFNRDECQADMTSVLVDPTTAEVIESESVLKDR